MNKVPEAQHGTDIMRVREHFLSGNGVAYRQVIMLSSFASAEMNALFSRTCANWAGRVTLRVDHQVGSTTLMLCILVPCMALLTLLRLHQCYKCAAMIRTFPQTP